MTTLQLYESLAFGGGAILGIVVLGPLTEKLIRLVKKHR